MKDGQDTGHGARLFFNFTGRNNSLSFYRAAPKRFLDFDFEGICSYTSLPAAARTKSARIFQHMSENAGIDLWSPKVRLLRSLRREYVPVC